MGSHGFDTTAKVDWQARQQLWQGVVFANHPMARIGMDGKSDEQRKGGYISNPFKTIQDRNVMVTMKWGPVTDQRVDPQLWIYFSSALDGVEEEQGWIFVKSGECVCRRQGCGRLRVGHALEAQRCDQSEELCQDAERGSPIIMVVNDAADYGNDFAVIQKGVDCRARELEGRCVTICDHHARRTVESREDQWKAR